jgi:uncharacterized membrane protein
MNIIDIEASNFLSWIYLNQYIRNILLFLFSLYLIFLPKLPSVMLLLYDNNIFHLLIVLLIIYLSFHDNKLAIMITIIYLVTLNKIKQKHIKLVKKYAF